MRRCSAKLGKEVGTALAVLALYILTLLAPLHQAAGLQRDLSHLGFETASLWSVCAALAADQSDDPNTLSQIKCPASGAGKADIALAVPPAAFKLPWSTIVPLWFGETPTSASTLPDHIGQSRAPPAIA